MSWLLSVRIGWDVVLLYEYRGRDSRYSVVRFDTSNVQCTRWTACLCCQVAESITFRGRINRNETLLVDRLIDACVEMQDVCSTRHSHYVVHATIEGPRG